MRIPTPAWTIADVRADHLAGVTVKAALGLAVRAGVRNIRVIQAEG